MVDHSFYTACLNNDLKTVRQTIKPSTINFIAPDGNTPLHIASSKGYTELVKILLRYQASRSIRNSDGKTAEQIAANDEISDLFKLKARPKSDANHYTGTQSEIEWLDSYKNAYRISYENLEHMKRWLLKVPFQKLLCEIDTGYVEKMKFSSAKMKEEIQDYITLTIEWEQPIGLVKAYSSGGTGFCTKLNYDLAEVGSDFRFLSTQNLFNSGYLDNEAPKGLGPHIVAAILIHHPYFSSYYRTGVSYRGMSVTLDELKHYKIGDIIMTRSFLSTSENEEIAKMFIPTNEQQKQSVMCVYTVKNARTGLHLEEISQFQSEKEVLIVPFAVFQITNNEKVDIMIDGKNCSINMINLEECNTNLP